MLNKVMLIGRLGNDPVTRFTRAGAPVCTFRIATDIRRRNSEGEQVVYTEWHSIVAWNKLAEVCNSYLRKGMLVFIEGRLQTRKWQDQNGTNHYTTEINAQTMTMLSNDPARRMNAAGAGAQAGEAAQAPSVPPASMQQQAPPVYAQDEPPLMHPAFNPNAKTLDQDVPF